MTLHSDDESTAKSSSFSRLPPRFPGCRDQDCSESKICKKWLIFVKMQHGRSRPKNFGSLKVAVILLKGIGKSYKRRLKLLCSGISGGWIWHYTAKHHGNSQTALNWFRNLCSTQ
jgi:hypothetical protein